MGVIDKLLAKETEESNSLPLQGTPSETRIQPPHFEKLHFLPPEC